MPGKRRVGAGRDDSRSAVSVTYRLGLAFLAMAGMFVVLALPLLLRYERVLVVWVAAADVVSFILFVVPLVSLVPVTLQLRFWYLFLFGSIVFTCILLGFLFREWPVRLFTKPYPGSLIPELGLLLAGVSCLVYLLLLRRAAARVRLQGELS